MAHEILESYGKELEGMLRYINDIMFFLIRSLMSERNSSILLTYYCIHYPSFSHAVLQDFPSQKKVAEFFGVSSDTVRWVRLKFKEKITKKQKSFRTCLEFIEAYRKATLFYKRETRKPQMAILPKQKKK